ncbi:unnamed protein product [Rhodiola kirilowii]
MEDFEEILGLDGVRVREEEMDRDEACDGILTLVNWWLCCNFKDCNFDERSVLFEEMILESERDIEAVANGDLMIWACCCCSSAEVLVVGSIVASVSTPYSLVSSTWSKLHQPSQIWFVETLKWDVHKPF